MEAKTILEEIRVAAADLADKVKSLIHEGNVRRIIVKDEHGHTFVEIPVTVGLIGAVAAPILAAIGALAAMAAKFTIVVEKVVRPEAASWEASTHSSPPSSTPPPPAPNMEP